MSRFLGPIHQWLFNKIKLYEELEYQIINNVEKNLDTDIQDIVNSLNEKLGAPIPNKPLEDLIDTNNIHGWLQNKITIAETRQAALITYIIHNLGESGLNIIKNTYEAQGKASGSDAKNNYEVSTAQELYKTLNNYILDGMPCDNVNNISINEDDMLQWKVASCLHRGYWNNVDGDLNVLYTLGEIWITSFIRTANPQFEYSFSIEENKGQKTLVHEISKK